MAPINYQPLDDMDNAWHQVVKTSFHGYGWIAGGIIVAIGVALIVFSGIGFVILVGYALYIGTKLQKYEDRIWQNFAAANGLTVIPKQAVKGLVPPTLLKAGNSRTNSEAVSGQLGSTPYNIFWFEFTIGSGKNSHSFPLTIISLQLNADLPHMLLRAQKALTVGETDQLKEKLKLEGDFNKYFKVFAEPDKQIDDLVILTPDVMQFLVTQDPAYNIEFYANNLYIIGDSDLRRADKLPPLIDFALKLRDQVLQNLPMAQARAAQAQTILPPVAPLTNQA
jgi:hypothetical protein